MNFDEYLASREFRIFQDETLRDQAIIAVNRILENHGPVKRNQLQAIPGVIQGAGLDGLRKLAEKQKQKSNKNKEFWAAIEQLLSKTAATDISLFAFLKNRLREKELISDEGSIDDKKEQKQLRKRNDQFVDMAMDHILDVYFEHFNCHYFFKTRQGG